MRFKLKTETSAQTCTAFLMASVRDDITHILTFSDPATAGSILGGGGLLLVSWGWR